MTGLFKKIAASSLYISTPTHWLKSRFHFSFAEYYNPSNNNFGVLRVLNDDLVTPRNGFGAHPHRDMEIVSYIVDGELTHQDSHGNAETLGRGAIQYMSAGSGVIHSEMNNSRNDTVRFLQLWITPDRKGHKVNYGSYVPKDGDRTNQLLHLVQCGKNKTDSAPVAIHQDANIFVSEIEPNHTVNYSLGEGRQAYLVCIEGELAIGGKKGDVQLAKRDAVEISGGQSLDFSPIGDANAHFLMVEMAA